MDGWATRPGAGSARDPDMDVAGRGAVSAVDRTAAGESRVASGARSPPERDRVDPMEEPGLPRQSRVRRSPRADRARLQRAWRDHRRRSGADSLRHAGPGRARRGAVSTGHPHPHAATRHDPAQPAATTHGRRTGRDGGRARRPSEPSRCSISRRTRPASATSTSRFVTS